MLIVTSEIPARCRRLSWKDEQTRGDSAQQFGGFWNQDKPRLPIIYEIPLAGGIRVNRTSLHCEYSDSNRETSERSHSLNVVLIISQISFTARGIIILETAKFAVGQYRELFFYISSVINAWSSVMHSLLHNSDYSSCPDLSALYRSQESYCFWISDIVMDELALT